MELILSGELHGNLAVQHLGIAEVVQQYIVAAPASLAWSTRASQTCSRGPARPRSRRAALEAVRPLVRGWDRQGSVRHVASENYNYDYYY